jgi:hypothetical protein
MAKVSKNAEVEALRERLARMPRAEVIGLCERAHVATSTIQKFRKRHIADIGADKYAALIAALPAAANDNNHKAGA